MKLLDREWNECTERYDCVWLADTEAELSADFAPDCSCGSVIFVISTGSTYMKNAEGKWQKIGSTEVI